MYCALLFADNAAYFGVYFCLIFGSELIGLAYRPIGERGDSMHDRFCLFIHYAVVDPYLFLKPAELFKMGATLLANIASSVPAISKLLAAMMYLIGFMFIFRGVYGLKQFGELRTMMSVNAEMKGHHAQNTRFQTVCKAMP